MRFIGANIVNKKMLADRVGAGVCEYFTTKTFMIVNEMAGGMGCGSLACTLSKRFFFFKLSRVRNC